MLFTLLIYGYNISHCKLRFSDKAVTPIGSFTAYFKIFSAI